MFFLGELQQHFFGILEAELQLIELILEKDFRISVGLKALVEVGGDEGFAIGRGDLLRARRIRIGITDIDQKRAGQRPYKAVTENHPGSGAFAFGADAGGFVSRPDSRLTRPTEHPQDRKFPRFEKIRVVREPGHRRHAFGHAAALKKFVLGL